MDGNPFSRTIWQQREKPLSGDWNQQVSQSDRALRFLARQMYALATASPTVGVDGNPLSLLLEGFLGSGFMVVPKSPTAMEVTVKAGLGFLDNTGGEQTNIDGISNLDDEEAYSPAVLSADKDFGSIVTPTAGTSSRIDIIEVKKSTLGVGNPLSREIMNAVTGEFAAGMINKTLKYDVSNATGVVSAPTDSTALLSRKIGVEALGDVAAVRGAGGVPATSPGYVKIAEINLDASAGAKVTIEQADIVDTRNLLLGAGGLSHITGNIVVGNAGTPGDLLTFTEGPHIPPGLRIGIFKSVTNLYYEAHIFVGDASKYSVTPFFQTSQVAAVAPADFYSVTLDQAYPISTGEVTAAMQAQFAAAGAPDDPVPPLDVAIGQHFIRVPFWLYMHDGATLAVGGVGYALSLTTMLDFIVRRIP